MMKTELAYYDVFPKVFQTGKTAAVTVHPLGAHAAFQDDLHFVVTVIPMRDTNLFRQQEYSYPKYEIVPERGSLHFTHCFSAEGPHALVIEVKDEDVPRLQGKAEKKILELRLYALEEDLFRQKPYRGDLHCHSMRSDGAESPPVIAANIRKAGYDFLAITDHEKFEPSLEAMEAYRGVPVDLLLLSGEEICFNNSYDVIHVCGKHSVREIIDKDPEACERQLKEIMEGRKGEGEYNTREIAFCLWCRDEIHKADGLMILPHPCWIYYRAYNIPYKMYEYLLRTKPFDAFELTGGNNREEHQAQINFWQEMRSRGVSVPITGSSDNHRTVNGGYFDRSKMLAFCDSLEREKIMEAVRSGQVVAIEQYTGEELPRLYGSLRYTEYAFFLLNEYFPLHDELCFEEGRLMKDYVCGDEKAAAALTGLHGRSAAMMNKYWA
jgi:predicted metal-dependent phosphoesterase TrpH